MAVGGVMSDISIICTPVTFAKSNTLKELVLETFVLFPNFI